MYLDVRPQVARERICDWHRAAARVRAVADLSEPSLVSPPPEGEEGCPGPVLGGRGLTSLGAIVDSGRAFLRRYSLIRQGSLTGEGGIPACCDGAPNKSNDPERPRPRPDP